VHGGRAFLAGVAIGAVTMAAIGLVASGWIESPLQVAAQTAPPAPSVLAATVRWQVLRNIMVFGGKVIAGKAISVTASAPFPTAVVTRLPVRAGQRVRPGHVIAEVDGRPIFLLRGVLPAYRDLREGDSGPDVTQLQKALERLGYADFDSPGYFGESSELALLLFYRHLGYTAPLDHQRTDATRAPGARAPDAGAPGAEAPGAEAPGAGGPLPGTERQPRARRRESAEVYLPMSEVTFIPAASALVVSVNARAGDIVGTGPVLRLATGEPGVTGKLGRYQAAAVRAGMTARIVSASRRLSRYGVVTYVGTYPVHGGQIGGFGYPIVVSGVHPLPERLIGSMVRLTVVLVATPRPVLAVPLAAITVAPGGATRVILLASGGRRVQVKVVTGVAAGGMVAVRPAAARALTAGDRVLIGPGR
jgi:peptidoglycan hydrolase-like protein with peptidoglycan-binding domain